LKEERPDILAVEGTRLDEEATLTEEDVRWQSEQIVKSAKGFVFVDFQHRDIYRLNTFKKVALFHRRAKTRKTTRTRACVRRGNSFSS
jgi:mRNA degradation ribonuclease J1/J2